MRIEIWGERDHQQAAKVVLTMAFATLILSNLSDMANAQTVNMLSGVDGDSVTAITNHTVSIVFDHKVWPIIMDVGDPLAKTMMAVGFWKLMRNDVTAGWQHVYRAGLGLLGLHGINLIVHLIDGVGVGLDAI